MVQVAPIMAQAASTALPPCSKMRAPAVAASGLPVRAIQRLAWSGGFCVRFSARGPPKTIRALTGIGVAVRAAGRPLVRALLGFFLRLGIALIWQTPCAMATLSALFFYPVKSMRGIACPRARLTATGLEWDRQWMVIDSNGTFLSQRTHPKLARIVPEVRADALVLSAPGMPALTVPLNMLSTPSDPVPVRVWKDSCTGVGQGSSADAW